VLATVDRAVAAFGRLDVVVNNAGQGVSGTVEEVTEAQARSVMDTNFFGTLWVSQAVAPRRLLLGDGDYDAVLDAYRRRIDEWESWEAVSRAAG